jgi:hypothetical protein
LAITFDVAMVYLLYASHHPESTRPAGTRTRVGFTVAIAVSVLLPFVVAISAAQSAQHLIGRCAELETDPM